MESSVIVKYFLLCVPGEPFYSTFITAYISLIEVWHFFLHLKKILLKNRRWHTMGKVYDIKSTQMTIGRPKPKEFNL